ncbi:hypothetical protein [Neorhizobium galegae]|uniref:hypothetical protein n=1 Tax=Neorhizobium galegae TaxID=399 RepID=UPI001FD91266|nr:hypothetical protein [Neorhizobium galegae]
MNETTALLGIIPGGTDLLARLGGAASFHDAEIVSLTLDRSRASTLVLKVPVGTQQVFARLILKQWIDVNLSGFSHQNVINRLTIRRTEERRIEPWEVGVGMQPGEFELALEPCFGAYGMIRANIERIELLDNYT